MPRTARQSTIQLLGALLALGVITLLVWTTTTAAFLDTTVNPGNEFGTGDVVLTDDDGGVSAFTVTDMAPGDSVTQCIVVTYQGSLVGSDLDTVDFYVDNLSGNASLGGDLTVTVEQGTGSASTFGNCVASDFTTAPTIANDTLAGLNGDGYGINTGTWVPASTGDSRAYRVTVALASNPDPLSEAGTVTADFVWEVQTP